MCNSSARESGKKLLIFLNSIYSATFMPMHYFIGQELQSEFPASAIPIDVNLFSQTAEGAGDRTFSYFTTDENLFMGIVRSRTEEESVVFGPFSPFPLSEDQIRKMIRTYQLDRNRFDQLLEFFRRTPSFSLNQLLHIMSLVNRELNGTFVDILSEDILKTREQTETVGRASSSSLMERKENERYHDTYFLEQELYSYVEKGDLEGLDKFMKSIPSFTEGSVASDSIRQARNIFIAAITQISRAAIAGGLDIETAYQLSDSYILHVEKMYDAAAITILNNTVLQDYTRRVAEARIPPDMSKDVFYCIQYISNHINQDITVEMLAESLHIERSTLSKKFKRELGFNISSYIMRRKLEEARSLLHYSDRSIGEISEYLCFSSQSYFQNVFKKKYGLTPKEFRKSGK